MSDYEEDFDDEYEEDFDEEYIEYEKEDAEQEFEVKIEEKDVEEIEEDEEEEEDLDDDEIEDEEEINKFNEKAKIKEINENETLNMIKIINEHKRKRLEGIKYMEFVAVYAYRYGTLCRGGNALVTPIKDSIDETIFKEMLEDKCPMIIQKDGFNISVKPCKALEHFIDIARGLLNL